MSLNRPGKRNALNRELALALAAALREAAVAPAVQCVVIRSEGPAFCAGIDLAEVRRLTDPAQDGRTRDPIRAQLLDCATLCAEMPKPVLCQIQGACLGAGLQIAIACDVRVAAADAYFAVPEVRLGIVPDLGGLSRLPALIGVGAAKDLVMTGRPVDAAEARQLGLITRVADPGALDTATDAMLGELSAGAAHASARAKLILDAAAHPALHQTLEMEILAQEHCLAVARERAGQAS